jgi:hypothetical protein
MVASLPCITEVNLIRHQDAGRVLVFLEQLMPHGYVLQRVLLGDIVDEDCELCIFEVGWDETAVSFLSGSVPHLKAVAMSVFGDVFDVEIDADSCLDEGGITPWVYSYLFVV